MPSEMLICAAREDLIVTVEMVNYDGVLENQLARAGTVRNALRDYSRHNSNATRSEKP